MEAIVGNACTTHGDEFAGLQDVSVTKDIERAVAGDYVASVGGLRKSQHESLGGRELCRIVQRLDLLRRWNHDAEGWIEGVHSWNRNGDQELAGLFLQKENRNDRRLRSITEVETFDVGPRMHVDVTRRLRRTELCLRGTGSAVQTG